MLDLVWVHFVFKLSCGSRSDLVVPYKSVTSHFVCPCLVVKDCSLKCAFYNCVAVDFVNFMWEEEEKEEEEDEEEDDDDDKEVAEEEEEEGPLSSSFAC